MKRLAISLVLFTAAFTSPLTVPCEANPAEEHFSDAMAMHNAGNLIEAVRLYSKAIENDDRYIMAYQMRGAAWQKMRQYQKAINDYTSVIELGDPLFQASGHFNRGVAQMMAGRYSEAITDFSGAIAIDRKMAAAFFHRGVARFRSGDTAGSIADLTEAARLGDSDAERWLNTVLPERKQKK